LLRRVDAGHNGRRLQRQRRGLKLAANYETRETPT
jgi:hypothetical protein